MFRYVFFDLDGTLLNTLDDLAAAGNFALRTLGLPEYDTDKYRYMVGNGIPKLIERMLPGNAGDALTEKAHALFSEYYALHSEDMTRPYEGIPEMLAELKRLDIGTAVITNKDAVFADTLIRKYFGDDIGRVYGSVPGAPRKPDPYWVNIALKEYGAAKSEVLYLGDSCVDMQTAANAGLTGAGVLWGFRDREELVGNGAKYICTVPADILDIIKRS
ncbi:MAG: HAD family hydrolase [Ruminiclostridium sp.]|nr:HAD family hydrolase [Ruminiclostridium sp.]